LVGGLGIVGILYGVVFGVLSVYNLVMIASDNELRNFVWAEKPTDIFLLIFGTLLGFAWGSCWLYSSRCFWNCRWKRGTLVLVIGMAVLFTIKSLARLHE
jgi:hypothetical protein